MSTPLEIKGIKKWRLAYDDSNWTIQQNIGGREPPNDWVNKYYFTELGPALTFLLKLGVQEEKLTDLRRIVDAYNKKSKLILDAIQGLAEHFNLQPPESKRIKSVKKAITKKDK